MVLVDTSVWIGHFRKISRPLTGLLEREEVLLHSFVIGELARGNRKNRRGIIALLHALPLATKADNDEVFFYLVPCPCSARYHSRRHAPSGIVSFEWMPSVDERQATANRRG